MARTTTRRNPQPRPRNHHADDPFLALQARIGQNIRTYRRAAGMTQEQCARALGLSTFFLGELERGFATAAVATLAHIASVLGVSLHDLVATGDHDARDDVALRREAAALLRTLEERDMALAVELLRRFAMRSLR